ncbi:MAG: M14 metallopeptidase family protein [Gemmataceae bacterium]
MPRTAALLGLALAVVALIAGRGSAQAPVTNVTTPKAHFGFDMGADYCLANYQQLAAYWKKLQGESDRIKLADIGKTEEGRPQLMAVVTSPSNHKRLDRYRDIARVMAKAEGVSEEAARLLAADGKAVVWIDGGLHASETLCAQVLIETVYRFLAGTDPETLRILDDVVILFVHANPDGHDLVADWYMKEADPKKRTLSGLPRLYEKYAGHDNNRDFYAGNLAETRNLNRVMYREWLPQIVYNHHQTGPAGTVLFCPPFRDPFNYRIEPLAMNGIDAVGAAMMQRFLVEGKPGATSRSGATYSTWYNGGLRTTCHFHNMIGLLTETIGSPTPTQIPFVPAKLLPKGDYLAPIPPQPWHFRQSVEYSVTANRAVLDYASRHREQLLFNIWRMGRNGIEAGNRDTWAVTPKVVAAATKDRPATGKGKGKGGAGGATAFDRAFRDPALRDPRGYVLPADQADFLTATKFVNCLLGTGVTVHRATAAFTAGGTEYPAGSYVVKCAQAFRPHVLDMFEPQDHPNDFAYPGAPPTRPYDTAGYTLAYQMGVKFDRLLDKFDGPFEEIKGLEVPPPPAKVVGEGDAAGFVLSGRTNDSFRAVNRLLKAGEEVRRLTAPTTLAGVEQPAGTFFVVRKPSTRPLLEKLAAELGTGFTGSTIAPEANTVRLKPVRVGLSDRYGGSMPSGWTRLILERFEFPFEVVFANELDRGNLRDRFDVLLFPDGAYAGRGAAPKKGGGGDGGDAPPADAAGELAEARAQRRAISSALTVPKLREFVEAGGTLLAIGGSTELGKELGVPLVNHLTFPADGTNAPKPLPPEKFYVPASVLRVKLDPAHPLAWGVGDGADVMFASSPTFRLPADGKQTRVAWFDGKAPLRSGWAWGQEALDGGAAVVEAKVGNGTVVLYGPQVLFRAQPHGTFKLVFNAIARAGSSSN